MRRHRLGKVVDASVADADGGGLSGQRQRMSTVDHRLALGNYALLGAPSEKSLFSVSSRILACRDSTPNGGSVVGVSWPNTPAAPLSSCESPGFSRLLPAKSFGKDGGANEKQTIYRRVQAGSGQASH